MMKTAKWAEALVKKVCSALGKKVCDKIIQCKTFKVPFTYSEIFIGTIWLFFALAATLDENPSKWTAIIGGIGLCELINLLADKIRHRMNKGRCCINCACPNCRK